jgi:eukaryotic-like serine/threonine-protein kinase
MTDDRADASEREQRLFEILEAHEQAIRAGDAPDRQSLLASHPDLASELAEFLDAQESLLRLTEPLRPLAEAITLDQSPAPWRSAKAFPPGRLVSYFGDYELIEEIARGGMGVVYRARQLSLNRPVALKLILAGTLASEADLRRFRNEAESVAVLDHPGIVPIFEVGIHEGQSYLGMKLIEGGSLADRLPEYADDPRSAARLLASVARAVHHAHQRGVLHRDLKPSNILVDRQGQPHVTDFGLARRIEGGSELTQSGALLGSPPYMAPEQTTGHRGEVTTSTDVYGLGAVLYAMLAGRPPFRADSVLETIEQVRKCAPESPSGVNPRVDRDLQTICLKCLDKDPPRRYASALELAEDLDRWLDGRPILARPSGPIERAWRWARRNPVVAGLSALVLILMLAGVAGLAVSNRIIARRNVVIEKERDNARNAQAGTEKALRESEESRRLAEAVSGFLVNAFRRPDPSQDGRELKVVDLLDKAAKLLDTHPTLAPRTKGELFNAFGQTYFGLGLPTQASEMFEKAIAFKELALGSDHPNTLASLGNLSTAYRSTGRVDESIVISERVLKSQERTLGPDHSDTIRNRNGLASAYFRNGRLAEAVNLLEQVVKACERKQGPDHPDTLTYRNNLAQAYIWVGRTSDAISLFEQINKKSDQAFGPGHPTTIRIRANLGAVYRTSGRIAEAIALLEPVLKAYEKNYGPDNLDTIKCREILALAYDAAGHFDRSEPLHRAAMERDLKEFGPDDRRSADAMAQFGLNLAKQKKWVEVEPLLRQCLSVRERVQADAWSTFNTRSQLGGSLIGQGKYAEAEPLVVTGYESMKSREATIPAEGKLRLAEAAERVVWLFEAWNKPEKANEWKARLGLSVLPAEVFARP